MTPASTTSPVGRRLAAARLRRGLAQAAVARAAGLAPSYLSRVENGKVQPAFHTVMHVARAIGADVAEIAGPDAAGEAARGPCPVTARGHCLLDLVRADPDVEHFTPRQIRLLRRFAAWIQRVDSGRVRAIELLLEDLSRASTER